jgi:hypothetical protein
MTGSSDSELTTIYIVLKQGSRAEHTVRVGTVNLLAEDERMQELIKTPEMYCILGESLKAWGETPGVKSSFVFGSGNDEERQDWQRARLNSPQNIYLLTYISLPPERLS